MITKEISLSLEKSVRLLFKKADMHTDGIHLEQMAGDGSIREFYRFKDNENRSWILMHNAPKTETEKKENLAYLSIGKHLFSKKLPLPEIIECDLEHGLFILEDLGDIHLEKALCRHNPIPLYEKAVEVLFRIQRDGKQHFNIAWCYHTPYYDEELKLRDECHYFRDALVKKHFGIEVDELHLDKAFMYIVEKAKDNGLLLFLHRDFQSRNIMLRENGGLAVIDWQGGRMGPPGYDLASLAYDPYPGMDVSVREHIINCYKELISCHEPARLDSFAAGFRYLAIQRVLQMLGAFAYLSSTGKVKFQNYIKPALNNLRVLLDEVKSPELNELNSILERIPV